MNARALAEAEVPPEPDALPDAPHPRETRTIHGQDAALADLAAAIDSGRGHHAWLLAGPQGVGKATLAWAFARTLIARPAPGGLLAPDPVPPDLTLDPDHPVARRVAALAEPRLMLVRRPWDEKAGRLKTEIPVDEIRRLKRFFALSAAEPGTRVAIIDSADEMNVSAANALLKILEEPPADTVLILIAHRPGRLLPTIRSRCRVLRCTPLDPPALAAALAATGADLPEEPAATARLARLAGGSVGAAFGLCQLGGLGLYNRLVALVAGMPGHDRALALALAEALSDREAEPQRRLAHDLVATLIGDLARTGATGQTPADLPEAARTALRRLAPHGAAARVWAETGAQVAARLAHGTAVNLDPQSLILDMVATLDATASRAQSQTGAQ